MVKKNCLLCFRKHIHHPLWSSFWLDLSERCGWKWILWFLYCITVGFFLQTPCSKRWLEPHWSESIMPFALLCPLSHQGYLNSLNPHTLHLHTYLKWSVLGSRVMWYWCQDWKQDMPSWKLRFKSPCTRWAVCWVLGKSQIWLKMEKIILRGS